MEVTWYTKSYVARELSVRDYVDWLVGVAWEYVHQPDDLAFDAVVRWTMDHVDGLEKKTAIAVMSMIIEDGGGVLDMCMDIVSAQRPPRWQKMREALRIRDGVPLEYQPTSGTGCECARCSGLSVDATDCKYLESDISVVDRMVGNLNLELALSMMDEPFWMYDLRQEQLHVDGLKCKFREDNPPDKPGGNWSRQQRHDSISARMRSQYHRGT